MSDILEEYRQKKVAKLCQEARELCAASSFAAAHGSGAVPCAVCGCGGNMDCGHVPMDTERCCTLDAAEVCPCCRVKAKRPNNGTHRREAAVGDVEMQTRADSAASRSVQ